VLDLNEEQVKRQLLKDYYKLKEILKIETDKEKMIILINDIRAINTLLEHHLLIDDYEYGYNKLQREYTQDFKRAYFWDKVYYQDYIFSMTREYDVFKEIYHASKKKIKNIKLNNNVSQNINKEIPISEYYDALFNVPFGDFKEYIISQVKGKKMCIINNHFIDNNAIINGTCINLQSLNKTYHLVINISKYSYLSMIASIHELAHTYIENKYNISTPFSIYREVIPYFNEFKTMDYFKSLNIGRIDTLENWRGILQNLVICLNSSFKKIIKNPDDRFFYVIGVQLGYYFYEIYKQDKEKCEKLVNYFLSHINYYDPIRLLRIMNINVEEFTDGKVIKRMIKNYIGECKNSQFS